MEPLSPAPQQALEALQRELSARQSVLHFAHAAVSGIFALIGAGASAKMFWDFAGGEREAWAIEVGWLAAGIFIYTVVRFALGRRALKQELKSFAQLQSLRRQLNQDDVSLMLPR